MDKQKPPLHYYKRTLNMKSVHIQCLDENQRPITGAFASGFILQEGEYKYLYTCWHVVTGFNMHNVEVGRNLPNRKFLEVNLQNCENPQPGIQSIGGKQSMILSLYDEKNKPLWIQNSQDVPNHSLNNIQLKVPFWHDTIKLLLPDTISLSEMQIIQEKDIFDNSPLIGDKVYIVGYPYGYSALGLEQPTPIVLTRFVAADRIKDRHSEILLDGPGAPGMSGGPVFLERNNTLLLLGIYTGLIYPDYVIEKNEKTTALGTMCNLLLWWNVQNE
jgi:hypothetical protein